jgi:CRISPR-associated protein Cmr3
MKNWIIIPRDALIFRDGKPFTAAPGSRAKTLFYPYPSTIAGAIRTMAGTEAFTINFDKNRIPELLNKNVRGPVLVELEQQGSRFEWLFPAPADALVIKHQKNDQVSRFWLSPISLPAGVKTDLTELSTVGPSRIIKDKPYPKPPRFWYKSKYDEWLINPGDGTVRINELGIDGPIQETRTHVSIAASTQTALPGALFQTSGLEFTRIENDDNDSYNLSRVSTLGMFVETDAEIKSGLSFMGGERRVACWQAVETSLPGIPDDVSQMILDQGHCRMILLTPGYFEAGYIPDWITKKYGVRIEAVITNRYQTISGWDYDLRKPKPTRRLVPAGSVYFIKAGTDKSRIQEFIESVWMNNVSDDEQSRRDGFGLAILGAWNGELRNMEVNNES